MPTRLVRLKTRADFLRVAASGRRAVRPGVMLQAAANRSGIDAAAVRVGFTASRKVGNAVVRNRAKRRLRAAAAESLARYGQCGTDYVLIARAGTGERRYMDLLGDLASALRQVTRQADRSDRPDRFLGTRPSRASAAAKRDRPRRRRIEMMRDAGPVRVLGLALRGAIRAYQLLISPVLPPSCRYYPSCSYYAAEAVERHGPWRGSLLAAAAAVAVPSVGRQRLRPGAARPEPLTGDGTAQPSARDRSVGRDPDRVSVPDRAFPSHKAGSTADAGAGDRRADPRRRDVDAGRRRVASRSRPRPEHPPS